MEDRLASFLESWTARRVMAGTLVVLGVLFATYMTIAFYSVILVMFVAFLLSTAVRPLVQLLQRLKIPPALGVIITYLLLLGALIGLGVLVLPLIADQISSITARIPEYYKDLRGMLTDSRSALIRSLSLRLPVNPPVFLKGLRPQAAVADDPSLAVTQLFSIIQSLSKGMFLLIAMLLLGFYWTLDGERVIRTLLQLVPAERRENARTVVTEMQQKLGAYLRGQLLLDLIIGILATIAYLIIGLDYAFVLGILAGLMETVPILGPILGAIPAVLIALSSGDMSAVWGVVVATVIIQQVENIFLVPRIMDRAVGINAVVTLLAFAGFSSFLGLVGGLLAVPLAAIIQILVTRFVFTASEAPTEITSRDRVGVLRYEAQELGETLRQRTIDTNTERKESSEELEDELEAIVVDLDSLLTQASQQGSPA